MQKSPALESQSSYEHERIRQLVEKEGKSARNLVTWSVPAAEEARSARGKPGARRRARPGARGSEQLSRSERMCVAAAGKYSNPARGGKASGRPANKADVHARYWSYLFDNLFRAVDEVYKTCEVDCSVVECQEVMMTLQACHRDFEALIHRIELERQLETGSQQRPSGVAWEIRKTTSPSKLSKPRPPGKPHTQARPPSGGPGKSIVQTLDMDSPSLSWADRVKGVVRPRAVGKGKAGQVDERKITEKVRGEKGKGEVVDEGKVGSGSVSEKMGVEEEEGEGREKESCVSTDKAGADNKKEGHSSGGEENLTEHSISTVPDVVSGGLEDDAGWKQGDEGAGDDGEEGAGDDGEEGVGVEGAAGDDEEGAGVGEEGTGDDGEGGGEVFTEGAEGDESSWSKLLREYDESEGRHVSWADRCESPPPESEATPPLFLAETPRSPGRAVTLHQRLSSPSRKRPIEEAKRMLEEKQAKAQQTRDRLVEEQRLRSKVEQEKVREARETRESRVRAWREGMEERLLRAEQLREGHLQEKRRKAQDEDAKVSEIAFINSLEAQNRKIQVLRRHQGHEARLADMAEERVRRREETAAREKAAQERRRTLEEERRAKLRELDERRKEQVAKIEQLRLERERTREEAAQEKVRERERRLDARSVAQQLSTEELERKIQTKQDESSRRHDQQLEQIKEKASGSRHTSCEEAPCVAPYHQRKWCTACSVPIISEVYLQGHERGRRHQEAVARLPECHAPLIITLDKDRGEGREDEGSKVASERLRAGRKRARKLRQRMTARWREQERQWQDGPTVQSQHRLRLQRCVKEVGRMAERCSGRPGLEKAQLQQLDRSLGEMARLLAGQIPDDQLCFQQLGGVAMVTKLFTLCIDPNNRPLPPKSLLLAVSALQAACADHTHNCGYLVAANLFSPLVDLLVPLLSQQAACSKGEGDMCAEPHLCAAVLGLLGSSISTLSPPPLSSHSPSLAPAPSHLPTLTDCISYLISVGVVDRLSNGLGMVSGPLSQPAQARLVISSVNLMVAMSAALHARVESVFCEKRDDPTGFTSALRDTELVGLLRLLYAMLLHDGPPRHSSFPPPLPPHTLSISTACLKAINNFAILDLHMVQACLGAEGISLEFRHVASYLMWHCTYHQHSGLLQEVLLAVGYFCVLHADNQVFLQSGRSPTLLQLLCNLPFEYFSNPRLSALLFPTLVSACHLSEENRAILSQEMSCQLLASFLTSHLSPQDSPATGSSDLTYRFPRHCWQDAVDFFSQ